MGTNYIAPIWRMPRNHNKNNLSNYSIDFSGGGSDYIIIGSSTELDNTPSNPYSFSFWFKSTTAGRVLSEKRATNTFVNAQYAIHLENGYVKWYGGADGTGTQTSTTLIDDEWHHIVCVAESTTVNKIYVDGQLDVTSSANRINSAVIAGTFNIGANYGGSYRFIGQLSQYCIFDYALTDGTAGTPDQISYLYNLNNPMAIDGAEPVAYWPLGDNSNPNAVAGYPNISVGADSVFDFNPSDSDYIEIPNNSSLQITDNLTLSCWVNASDVSATNSIIDKFYDGTDRSYLLRIAGTRVKLYLGNTDGSSAPEYQSTATLSNNIWYHIATTFSSADNEVKIYINGDLDSTHSKTDLISSNNEELRIGTGYNLLNYFDGEISNVQVWNGTLTDGGVSVGATAGGEVATLYNNGQPLMTGTQPQEANLRAWWKLNQTANWEADTAGEWQIPDNRSAFPQCFEFDGISDKVTIPKGSMTDTGSKSVSIWIKNEITSGTDYVFNSRAGGYLTNGITLIQTTTTGYIYSNSDNSKIYTGYQSALRIPNDGQWHHIAWTADHTTHKLKVYINGVFVYEFTGSATTDTTPSTDITVGATTSPWTGKLSNFQIWDDVVLSDGSVALNDPAGGQIAELYNNGIPNTTAIESSNLKAWYKLNNNEIFNGTNWEIENQKYPASYESALKFPGNFVSGTGINFSPLTINATQANTYSAWVYPIGNTNFWTMLMGDYSGTTPRIGPISLRKNGGSQWCIRSTQRSMNTPSRTVVSNPISNNELNKWHHIMVVVDNLDVSFYLNGQPHGTATFNDPWTNSTFDLFNIGNFGNWVANGYMSNIAIWDSDQSTNIANIYNSGTPQNSYTVEPIALWKLDNTTTGINDIIGGRTGTLTGDITKVNTFVSKEAGESSGMTEQNLVNNNVSTLNGESTGMTSANLVQSNISKQIPFSSYSVYFDGAGDTFDIPDATVLKPQNITVSMWLNGGTQAGTYRYPLAKYYTGSGPAYGFSTGVFNNKIQFLVRNGGDTAWDYAASTAVVLDGNWHHIVGTLDGSSMSLYVDGALVATNTNSSAGITYGSGDLTIGSFQPSSHEYDGNMSNVAIWDSALDQDDILNLYNNGVPQDLNNFRIAPVAWYPMDQSYTYFNGSVLVARDVISGNDGTGANITQEKIIGNAPGSEANGTGTNLTIADLIGDMKDSKLNAYSINMADYADGVTNPADSGRSTEIPSI